MRKKYAILHITSGSYAWIGTDPSDIYTDSGDKVKVSKTMVRNTLKHYSENPEFHNLMGVYGFFAGAEFLAKYKNIIGEGQVLIVPSKKQAKNLISAQEFRNNIAMDLFTNEKESEELMPWEFEIVDVTKGVE